MCHDIVLSNTSLRHCRMSLEKKVAILHKWRVTPHDLAAFLFERVDSCADLEGGAKLHVHGGHQVVLLEKQ